MRIIPILVVLTLLLGACSKQPGEGGLAKVRGRVIKEIRLVLTNPETATVSYPAPDEDIWIIYGNGVSPDDRERTNFDGEFQFRFLRPGDYTIYVYSRDTTGQPDTSPNRMPIIRTFTIDERREDVDLGDLIIYDRP